MTERQRKVYPIILPGLNEGTLEMADMVLNVQNYQHNNSSQLLYNHWLRKPKKEKSDNEQGGSKSHAEFM